MRNQPRPPRFHPGQKAAIWEGGTRIARVRVTARQHANGVGVMADGSHRAISGWVYQTDRTGDGWVPETALKHRPEPAGIGFDQMMAELGAGSAPGEPGPDNSNDS